MAVARGPTFPMRCIVHRDLLPAQACLCWVTGFGLTTSLHPPPSVYPCAYGSLTMARSLNHLLELEGPPPTELVNCIITAYSRHGFYTQAMQLFETVRLEASSVVYRGSLDLFSRASMR